MALPYFSRLFSRFKVIGGTCPSVLRRVLYVLFVVFSPLLEQEARSQQALLEDGPLSERRVSYTMDVELDPEAKAVHGTQRITWRNPDTVPVDELQFHMYLNAFKNEQSTFMVESGGEHRGMTTDAEDPWGGVDITSLRIASDEMTDMAPLGEAERDLTEYIQFIQPDDNNVNDQTVISVALPDAVQPGETITLDVEFESKLPQIFARTGWQQKANDSLFFMVAQWFPKLGVYEIPGQRYVPIDAEEGAWSTHQFHANSEFYADFGTYDVTITTPEHYTVGATGVEVRSSVENGKKTVTYRAEDVHDFAWTASGEFLTYMDSWGDVSLKLLLQPEHKGQEDRHFQAVKLALEKFDEWVGPYPYSTLTLIDGVGGSNGMEYPTLFTCGTYYQLPSWLRILEVVTIHEFGHQYFYGLLASNEAEEAWLDEGINSYLEVKIMDEGYGSGSVIDLPAPKISDGAFQRLNYTRNRPGSGALFTRSWEYTGSDYGKASYSKPATVLLTLEGYLGWETMKKVLQTYYQRWRFRHPTTRDFQAVVEDVSGQDLDWFFEAYVYGTDVIDYSVTDLDISLDAGTYKNEVVITRLRNGVFPQTLQVTFADGRQLTETWDGQEQEKRFLFSGDVPLHQAYLDPDFLVRLDISRINNRRVVEAERSFARKQQLNTTLWLQRILYLFSGLF